VILSELQLIPTLADFVSSTPSLRYKDATIILPDTLPNVDHFFTVF